MCISQIKKKILCALITSTLKKGQLHKIMRLFQEDSVVTTEFVAVGMNRATSIYHRHNLSDEPRAKLILLCQARFEANAAHIRITNPH